MFIVNPSGVTVGVSEEMAAELLKKPGFRLATEAEAEAIKPVPAQVPATGVSVYHIGHNSEFDGYGESTDGLFEGLRKAGIGLTKDKKLPCAFVYGIPDIVAHCNPDARVLMLSMFESTSIPADWVQYLRKAWKVLVPSKFCQTAFTTRGIRSEVVPIGYNEAVYTPIDRPERPVFTFLHYNAFNIRKGFDLVFNAFREVFGDDPKVRLVLKTVRNELPFPILKSEYPNIDVVKGAYSQKEMRQLMGECDCLVFPSRGEGIGLPPLECMATGMPVIVTNGSGMAEYADPRYFHLVDVEGLTASLYKKFDTADVGQFVEPSFDSLKEQMRRVYEHQDEARAMAQKGAKYVAKHFSMAETVKQVARHINDLVEMDLHVDNLVDKLKTALQVNPYNQEDGGVGLAGAFEALQFVLTGPVPETVQVPMQGVKAPAEPPRKPGRPPRAETKVADQSKRVDKQFGSKKPIKKKG